MTGTMKAVCIHQFGGLDALSYQDLPRPMPAAGELLIRVHAAGVNPVDRKTRTGSVPWKGEIDPFPLGLGDLRSEALMEFAEAMCGPGQITHNHVQTVEPFDLYSAIVSADKLGHERRALAGKQPLGMKSWESLVPLSSLQPSNSYRCQHGRQSDQDPQGLYWCTSTASVCAPNAVRPAL